MNEETVVAAPSAAPVVEVERGAMVNMTSDQRAEFRKTGDLPTQEPQKEDPATSTEEKPAAEVVDPSAPPQKPQESKRKPDAEQRIKQLTDEAKRYKAELEALKTAPKTEPAPQLPQQTRQKPTAEDKDESGKLKYQTYEDFVEDLADWKAEQRWTNREREVVQQAQRKELDSRVADAKQRYGDTFEQVLKPAVDSIVNDQGISPVVKQMLNESEILPDLLFKLGSDPEEMANFLNMAKTNPGKAIRYIALTESLIREDLTGKPQAAPVKTQTSAPKPPAEVGGRATAPADAMEAAAKAGDFASYKREANRRALAQLKG